MEQNELEEQLIDEFGCNRSDAREISVRASNLKSEVESNPEIWDGPEIEADSIVSRLEMAPKHLSVTGKWNWWIGMSNSFGVLNQDFRIN